MANIGHEHDQSGLDEIQDSARGQQTYLVPITDSSLLFSPDASGRINFQNLVEDLLEASRTIPGEDKPDAQSPVFQVNRPDGKTATLQVGAYVRDVDNYAQVTTTLTVDDFELNFITDFTEHPNGYYSDSFLSARRGERIISDWPSESPEARFFYETGVEDQVTQAFANVFGKEVTTRKSFDSGFDVIDPTAPARRDALERNGYTHMPGTAKTYMKIFHPQPRGHSPHPALPTPR